MIKSPGSAVLALGCVKTIPSISRKTNHIVCLKL